MYINEPLCHGVVAFLQMESEIRRYEGTPNYKEQIQFVNATPYLHCYMDV